MLCYGIRVKMKTVLKVFCRIVIMAVCSVSSLADLIFRQLILTVTSRIRLLFIALRQYLLIHRIYPPSHSRQVEDISPIR